MAAPPASSASLFKEWIQPFVDVIRAPRALWGVNLAYVLEGMVYFGMLGYLAMHFSDFVFQGVPHPDEWAHSMVMVLTAGITIAMFFLGFVADRKGVRFALLTALCCMLAGRILVAGAPTLLGLEPAGPWSGLHLVTMLGILTIVVGYGMYQPAAYAAVRQFTTPKTAAMGFAMLYALMNLGGWLPTFAFLLRDDDYLGLGIPGTFWVYTSVTALALLATALILSRRTVARAIAWAKEETARIKAEEKEGQPQNEEAGQTGAASGPARVPPHAWTVLVAILAAVWWRMPAPWSWVVMAALVLIPGVVALLPRTARSRVVGVIANHPLANTRFFFFIFALIPVQTLFTYNWLILPQYIHRAYEGWIGEYFEIAANANPLLIFILVPVIAAATRTTRVYTMMIVGTFVMAAPAFLLSLGPHPALLAAYILVMTIGEAIWQPRFLQYAAEIAPEGRTGEYMGVAQLPWFLTKVLVPLLYSGWMMDRYCPAEGVQNTGFMWLVFGCIAICTPILLVIAKGWVGRDFKTRAA
ncbi:MAG: MFS transporter [Deltaproteobacteria bacterium]|nr:MFS transporter [Deltaproteobacteria bacterium]